MLVLARKAGESLYIGDNIQVTIVEIGATSVKISIDAPKDVMILRNELKELSDVNKQAASHLPVELSAVKNIILKKK